MGPYLPQEVAGSYPVVVPHGDLQQSVSHVGLFDSVVNKRLVPRRLDGVSDRFSSSFALLTEKGNKPV